MGVAKCVQIYHSDILPYITDICSVYKNFMGQNYPVQEQYIAIFVFNNLVHYGNSTSIYQSWIPYVVQLVNSTQPTLRKAAVTAMSILAEFAQDIFPQILANVINRLNATIVSKCSRDKYLISGTQTAIAAVGRIIEIYPSQIDIPQVLPIWLSYLPVTTLTEAHTIYQQLCCFFLQNTEILLGENFVNLPRILQLFVAIIGTALVSSDTSQTMISIVKQMQSDFPGELMQQAWVTLSPTQQDKLRQILNSA